MRGCRGILGHGSDSHQSPDCYHFATALSRLKRIRHALDDDPVYLSLDRSGYVILVLSSVVLKIHVSVVRFDVQDAQVSQRLRIAESDPPLATIKTTTCVSFALA